MDGNNSTVRYWRMMRKIGLVSGVVMIATLLVPATTVVVAEPMTPWQWQREEVERFFEGAREVQLQGWGALNAKVNRVIIKLVRHTNSVFRVVPGQTNQAGVAHAGGWIVLDISTAMRNDEQLAFWLSHEWGHEYLGHQPNYIHPNGRWRIIASPTADEDAADEFAGTFLCKAGYSLDSVVNMLRAIPVVPGDSHSTGSQRARIVSSAYAGAGCTTSASPPPVERSCRTITTPCTHPAHPSGDLSPCRHPAHMADQVPCMHSCPTLYGWAPCHPYDVIPCTHPAHPLGDVSACTHIAHPAGHSNEVCE